MLLGSIRRWGISVWHGAVVVALAAWGLELFLGSMGPLLQLVLAGLSLTAVAAAAYVTHSENRARQQQMRQFLEAMCRDDVEQFAGEADTTVCPSGMDPVWSGLLHRLRD